MKDEDKRTPDWWQTIAIERQRRFPHSQQQGGMIKHDSQQLHNFASNDYLGLSQHPAVLAAAQAAMQDYGLGSGASRYVCADAPVFHQLESALADWKGAEACLLLGSGMLANIGLMQALCTRHSEVFADRFNHASLVDGIRLSGAKLHRFPHTDMNVLTAQLEQSQARQKIIVSDGVFSMDGDEADVSTLIALAERYDAWLVLDDAHGNGCLGASGAGLTAEAGIQGHPRLIEVGTFGKAFGGYGAFIVANAAMIHGLLQRLRTAMYSTALPPMLAAAMLESLHQLRQGDWQQALAENIRYFRAQAAQRQLALLPSRTPIQPLIVGGDAATLRLSQHLHDAGFFVPAIRPPTVPAGTARLRITISAQHERPVIHALIECLASV